MSAATEVTTLRDETLEAVLPHRAPILMIDSIDIAADHGAAVAYKQITADEPCYVSTEALGSTAYPRALLVESLGQAAAALWLHRARASSATSQMPGVLYFAKAEGVTFLADVFPGDHLVHEVVFERDLGNTAFMSGRTLCNGEPVALVRSIIAAAR